MKKIKINSNHAVVDMLKPCKRISNHISKGGSCHVIISGYIRHDDQSLDDGISVEYTFRPDEVLVDLKK